MIRLNLSGIRSASATDALEGLVKVIGDLAFDVEDKILGRIDDEVVFELLDSFKSRVAPRAEVEGAVQWMCGLLEKAYGEKVVVLVDEYDQCIHNIRDKAVLDEVMGVMTPFMQQSFKTNDHIRLGVVTGVMPLLQTGMTSGFNNPMVCDILVKDGDEYFGFTESEVMQLLNETGTDSEKLNEIREWYDGYRFGDADVYNPFSVIQYLNNGCKVSDYWNKTSSGGLSAELISRMDVVPMNNLKGLYEDRGSFLESKISSRILYTDAISPDVEPSVVYSYLAMAGYLKVVDTGKMDDDEPVYRVTMVNREVSKAFDTLVKRASELAREAPMMLNRDIYSLDPESIRRDMVVLLSGRKIDKGWNHDRYKEFFGGQLDSQWLHARDEIPRGIGICDIFVPSIDGRPAVIFEFKTSSTRDPKDLSMEARNDIRRKGYSSEPLEGDVIEIAVGIRVKDVHVRTELRRGRP